MMAIEKRTDDYNRYKHGAYQIKIIMSSFRYSVTAITLRFHRRDRGSTPRIGVIFILIHNIYHIIRNKISDIHFLRHWFILMGSRK